jgi:hypothetical protein
MNADFIRSAKKGGEGMNRKIWAVAALVCFAVFMTAAIASAQPRYHDFYRQIDNQQRSIDHGVRTHQLGHRDADIAQYNLNRIRARLDRYRGNDGILDGRERNKIQRMLDKNERMIRRMKHTPPPYRRY